MRVAFECNLCKGVNGHTLPFRYRFKERYLWAVSCDGCGLVSIWPRPSDPEIEEMYSADYFTGADKATHHMDVDYLEILNAGDYKEGVEQMKARCAPGSHVLEIGCATGNYLYALNKAGYHVKGIELSSFAVDYAAKNFNLSLINKPFDEHILGVELQPNEMDVIIMGDVLEHFTDPTQAMKLVYQVLKPGGVALIQVPGTLNLLSSRLAFVVFRLLGKQKTMSIPPYHLTEFSGSSIRKMCEAAGFTKIKIEHHIKHPRTIPLRGSFIENMIKKGLQYPNYYLTKWLGIHGDRIHVEASK
ncbi:MAG: class I SAM-dependent methyltransferase [Bacteroidia bacterium]